MLLLDIVKKLLGMATVYVVIRVLNKNQFGNYQFILSVLSMLTIFSLSGMNNAVMQSVARGKLGTFRLSLKLSVLSSLFGSLILLTMGMWYYLSDDNIFSTAFFILSVSFPFTHGLTCWGAVKHGQKKFASLFKIEGVFALLNTLVVVGVSLTFRAPMVWILVATGITHGFKNLIFTCYLLNRIDCKEPVEEKSIRYGIKTTLNLSFNIIANNIDKLLVYSFFSPASLAVYYSAERISVLTKGVGQSMVAVLAPEFAKKEIYTTHLNKRLNRLSMVLGGAIIIFAFTLLPYIMTILFGENYKIAIPYAQVLLCSVAVGNNAVLKNRYIKSKIDEKSDRDVMLSTSLIRIIGSAVLVPLYGIWGAVISTVIYRISVIFMVKYIIEKRYHMIVKKT